jgi:hypothetical protein
MLDPDVGDTGVAVALSAKSGRSYAVQRFGRLRSASITFTIRNDSATTVKYTVDGKVFSLRPRYTVTHQHCRPPKLEFEEGAQEKEKAQVFHPHKGDHFVIQPAEDGGYQVARE